MARHFHCLVFLLLISSPLFAQDAKDCQDHPQFARMDHFYIESCKSGYDTFHFRVGTDKHLQPIAGYGTTIHYTFDPRSGSPMPELAGLVGFYEQISTASKGRKIYSGPDEASFSLIRGGKEYWITIRATKTPSGTGINSYTLIILDKKVGR